MDTDKESLIKCGCHVLKCDTYYKTLTHTEYESIKCKQIFTGSTKSYYRKSLDSIDEDIKISRKYVDETQAVWFIHSIYIINLCRIGHEFVKPFEYLKYEFEIGYRLGMRGVVVHVGKSLDMPIETGLDNMYNNIISLIPFIYEQCPLLIETPAGQGTELLSDLEDFKNFYNRFGEDEKKKVRLCVDTCHVFSSGYNPLEYLEDIYTNFPCSLVLVHYNDSKCEMGSCKDRHEFPGDGYIGKEAMSSILKWCMDKDVPIVIE